MKVIPWVAFATVSLAAAAPAGAERFKMDESDIRKVEPGPDRERATPFKPTWCGVVEEVDVGSGAVGRTAGNMLERNQADAKTVAQVATMLCVDPDEAGVQKQAGFVAQQWMNWTGLTQKDAIASIAARADAATWEKQRAETCAQHEVGEEDAPETKALTQAQRMFYGCSDDGPVWMWRRGAPDNLLWWLDRGAQPPSELLRTTYVLVELPDEVASPKDDSFRHAMRGVILAGLDAAKLDPARLEAELASGNDYAKVVARENMARARADWRMWQAAVSAAAAKDPDLKKVVIDAPAEGWAAWEKTYASDRVTFDEGAEFEKLTNSPSLSAVKGCAQKQRPTIARLLKRLAPSDPRAAEDAVKRDPVAGPAFKRWALCLAMEKEHPLGETLYYTFKDSRGHRGPRIAAYFAAVEAAAAVVADRPKFAIQPGVLHSPAQDPVPPATMDLSVGKTSWFIDDDGVVASTKKVPGGVLVTFKKESYMRQEWNCKPTNRIIRINSSGIVEYEHNCTPAGKSEVVTTPRPIVVAEWLAGAIAPGRLVVHKGIRPAPGEEQLGGLPVAVYDGKAQKKLLALWGVEL
jgi:hypothetical protein